MIRTNRARIEEGRPARRSREGDVDVEVEEVGEGGGVGGEEGKAKGKKDGKEQTRA